MAMQQDPIDWRYRPYSFNNCATWYANDYSYIPGFINEPTGSDRLEVQMWGPQMVAKLVNITLITMVYGTVVQTTRPHIVPIHKAFFQAYVREPPHKLHGLIWYSTYILGF